ncbi:DNA-binding protein [Clostridium tetani]|uniref:DNA-binding protein n=1 Tax=Clostridium tetani TaxID=1513 RepID=UPI001027016A|nr:DNA-binding protein [Clostridium tetani]RXI70524.1 DNA-binding protein [Clostridium tetani]
MNKKEFNRLNILEQVEYINNSLIDGSTVTKVCKDIGIARSTVGGRFKKEGYCFNNSLNRYELENNILVLPSQKDNTINEDLLELIDMKPDLIELIKFYKKNEVAIDMEELNINNIPEELKDNIKNRSIKVYDAIYTAFDELCSSYSSIKKQDLLSLALFEFIQKYKK